MSSKLTCSLLLLAALLAGHAGSSDSEPVTPEYYCLEDYKPVGDVIRQPRLSARDQQGTSGHIARQCSAACSAEPSCTAFTAAGNFPPSGASCQLLTNTTAVLPTALQLPKGADWPPVLVNVTAGERVTLRSLGWLCFRGAELWDAFGRATHALIHTGVADPNAGSFGHDYHCAFGSDVAGTNLKQYTTPIGSPLDCDQQCVNSSGCTVWTFAAAQEGTGQDPYNCFIKADPFRGQNGWTGKPKPDIWIPDSQADCFVNLGDWRELGLILSPAVKTVSYNNTYYTLYPERVAFREAQKACANIPGGRLAILDTRMEVDTVYRELLSTLSPETGVTSAWIGVTGNNTHFNPNAQNQTGLASGMLSLGQIGQLQPQPVRDRTASGPESTLRWLNGEAVDQSQLRRLTQHDVWTVHDVIWNQQYVPDSSQYVCGRVLVQSPPTNPVGPVDPSAVLPGVWYFDCDKLAAFVCQSPDPPNEPMVGRSIVTDDQLAAVAGQSSSNSWRLAVAVVVPVLAVLLAAWQLSRVYSRQVSRLPELIRQQRKRALGQPHWGRMSIVVTDIQGFTNLMRDAPDHMAQALLLHNQVMKHACYDNIGYVLEQEGDSFTLAFHEPTDAVAFTLQVQQALLEQSWASEISYHDAWDSPTSIIDAANAQQQQQLTPDKQRRFSGDRSSSSSPTNQTQQNARRMSLETVFGWIPGIGQTRSDSQSAAAVGGGRRNSSTSWLSDPNLAPFAVQSTTGTDYSPWPPSTTAAAAGASGSSVVHPAGFSRRRAAWLQQLLSSPPAAAAGRGGGPGLFKGLRVRMGVASGFVVKGQEVKSSALYKTAQDVSNAANGGQVLMCETTFHAVKEELWRLGLVTASGLNYDLLYSGSSSSSKGGSRSGSGSSRTGSVTSRSRLLGCVSGRRSSSGSSGSSRVEHALALDMGCYDTNHNTASHHNHHAAAGLSSHSKQCTLWTQEAGGTLVQQYQQYLQQRLQVDQQSDDSINDIVMSSQMTTASDSADIEQGFYTPAQSATMQSLRAGLPQQNGLLLPQRQQRFDEQQDHDLGWHGGHEKVIGVWRAVLGGLVGFRQSGKKLMGDTGRDRDSYYDSDPSAGGGMLSGPSAVSFPGSSWSSTDVGTGSSSVRLYQIIAPSLIGRAALFGSELALPKHWKQVDAPYFAAPGLSTGSSGSSAEQPAAAHSSSTTGVDMQSGSAATGDGQTTGQTSSQVVVDQYLVKEGTVQQLLGSDAGSAASNSSDVDALTGAVMLTPDQNRQGATAAAAADAAGARDSDVSHKGRPTPAPLVTSDLHTEASPFAAAAAAATAAAAIADQQITPSAVTPRGSSQSTSRSGTPISTQQQQQRLSASAVVTNSALLRGMSLRADFALPSFSRIGSSAGGGGGDGLRVSVLRPQYPPVTIVFAMVEGAQQLLRCPTLARSSHVLIHRLLLQTMTHFPGSYLVRAQEGDLKYMAAFPTPTAAVEWCCTVQEASLYAPYPQEALGLSSCGVQLDAAGRLVFRGPRFKMGLSEGTPKCILPDHLGRADYHGPFVNQAARYADASAHGGQIVTDHHLADKVMAHWRIADCNRHSSSSRQVQSPKKQQQQPLQQQQQQHQDLWQQQSPSPKRLIKSMSADTALMRDTSAARLHQPLPAAAADAAARIKKPPPLAPSLAAAAAGPQQQNAMAPSPAGDHTPVNVECSWLGSFLYKGNPQPIEMVCFAPDVLAGRSYPSSSPGGKGVRVVQRVGVVDTVPVLLPAAVEGM